MNKKRFLHTGLFLIFVMMINTGCAVIGTALSAGMAYGIYQATRK